MIIDFAVKHNMLPQGSTVLAAVSGGKDSMCLLHILKGLEKQLGFKLVCAHFDHCLRGEESKRDKSFVENYCAQANIHFVCGSADVAEYAREKGLGIEEAARILRYDFLERTADKLGAQRIATAHTAEDNAETLLMNLSRGCGLTGLCGIPPVRGKIVRPMLEMTTAEVIEYLENNGVPHVEDSSNQSDDYTRNRLRHRVIPELYRINPAFGESAARCISLLREDDEYLSTLAEDFLKDKMQGKSFLVQELVALPPPIFARVVRMASGTEISKAHVEAVQNLLTAKDPHAAADLPGIRVFRDYERLVFGQTETGEITPRTLLSGENLLIPEAGVQISRRKITKCIEIHNSVNTFCFKSGSICGNITVASRRSGENIRLAGRNCTKSLKKLFSEARLNGEGRGAVPVLYDELGAIAVSGLGIAERCIAQSGDDVDIVKISPLLNKN